MPIYQKPVSFDRVFQQLSNPPIIVNDLINSTEEDRNKIRELVVKRYSSDMLSVLPVCNCGHTRGEHAIGTACQLCGTLVQASIDDSIEPILWCRRPNGVEKLISPIFWIMLKNKFKKNGFNIIQYLCDTAYRPPVKQPAVLSRVLDTGIQRGYNNFVVNFTQIMETLFTLKEFSVHKNKNDPLYDLLKENNDCIFSDYLPLPNRSLLIIEKTNVGVYVDPVIVEAIDAIEIMTSIDSPFTEHTQRVKENRTVKSINAISEFCEGYIKTSLASRSGQFRRHIFGSRANFSFRAVISSLTGPHLYNELHVPWGVGLSAFRPHLLNKLEKTGMSLNAAVGYLFAHIEKYDPMLDSMLQSLIQEAPNKRIICIAQRN